MALTEVDAARLNDNVFNTVGPFTNRIINGDMRIDQRNAGASVTPTVQGYTLDRWRAALSVGSKYSVQQSSTAATGFTNSLLATSLSAYTVGAAEWFGLQQSIEGFNSSDLAWGTANAKTVTLSFWVRSSLTGTFGGSLANSDASRSYPFSYTISSANTFEYKTITIAGDTSGTWLTTNGIGIRVTLGLGVGSNFSATAGSWAGAEYYSATGATSVVATNGATFYITGVQLEAGSVATPFERIDYSESLRRCQRYCFRWGGDGLDDYIRFPMGYTSSSTEGVIFLSHPVPMRSTTRSLTTTAPNGIEVYSDGIVDTSFTSAIGNDGCSDTTTMISLGSLSGLTTSRVFAARFYNSVTANFLISSEL